MLKHDVKADAEKREPEKLVGNSPIDPPKTA